MKWLKVTKLCGILCLTIVLTSPNRSVYITNPVRSDGFGAQYQTIMYTAFYAEQKQITFVYTPFKSMEHNYNNDADFLSKKESLINLINHVTPAAGYTNVTRLDADRYIRFVESNINLFAASKALQEIRQIFRANKPVNYFNNDKLNIAVHIRRPNPHDCRLDGADVADKIFLKVIDELKHEYSSKKYLIHIYSQGNEDDFKAYAAPNVIFHINESIEDTFTALALADVLVMSPSSFSYTAGLISTGKVYYLPFWHAPLPGWQIVT